jgi:hypothetical protein
MSEQSPHFFTEAPASATVKVTSAAGYEWLLTTRANTSGELLDRLYPIEAWLQKHKWQPATRKPQAAQAAANGSAAPANGAIPLCPTHNSPMKPSKHGTGYFCPVKVADDDGTGKPVYCKQSIK